MNSKNSSRTRINCSFSRHDILMLKSEAKKHKKKLTTFVKDASLAYAEQKYLVPEDLELKLQKTLLELRRIGNNINQITRHTNTIQKLTLFNAIKAQALLDKLEYKVNKLVKHPRKPSKHDH